MRRIFADVLKSNKIDITREYSRLYDLFYKSKGLELTIYEAVNRNFNEIWFRGTCNTLVDFDNEYGFKFEEQPQNFDVDYLINFCEYVYNISHAIRSSGDIYYCVGYKVRTLKEQVEKVIELVEHTYIDSDNGLTILVPEKPEAIYVAEVVSESLSNKILEYNHHSLQNNLEGKKEILLKIADELEPQRADLSKLDSSLESNLFYAFNKFNIRHNNCNPKAKTKYVSQFALLSNEEKEELYDWAYNQSLIAFIKLENAGLNEKFKEIKNKIDNNIIE